MDLRQIPFVRIFLHFEPARGCGRQTALVFVTNPDNPSGHTVPDGRMADLAGKLPPRAIWWVNEAYADSPIRRRDNLLPA